MDRYVRLLAPILVVALAGCSSGGSSNAAAPKTSSPASPFVSSDGFKEPFTYTLPSGWSLTGTGDRDFSD